jgi:acyl-CoA synthetase (AMP-forming)/AMP-acid ligase II
MTPMNVVDCFRLSAQRYPHQQAFEDARRAVTYQELDERTNRLANRMIAMGLGKGDKCGILLFNSVEYMEAILGLAKAGIIPVPVNFRFSSSEVAYIMENSESKAMIMSREFVDVVSEAGLNLGPDKFIVVDRPTAGPGNDLLDYEDELANTPDTLPAVTVNPEDVYYIGYTSGTTSFPKGVVIPHDRFIEHATTCMLEYSRMTEDDRFLLIMPLCHSNSIWFASFTAIMGGYAYIYPSKGFDAEEMLKIIEEKKITITSVVPTMLNLVLNLPPESKDRYSQESLQTLLVASAPLTTTTKEGTLRFFSNAQLYEAYGATEISMVTVLKPRFQWEKIRCVGRPQVFKEIKLLDEEGREVPVGQPGELYVRGKGIIMREYYNNPEATTEAFRGEWITVGDIAKKDEEGFIYLVDRKKDMIISGGENVSPAEVEDRLYQHPAVLEAAVVGVPDEKWGEAVTAVVVRKVDHPVTEAEIFEHCRSHLAGFKTPKKVFFTDELPKTATQKISRKLVRESFAGDTSLYQD